MTKIAISTPLVLFALTASCNALVGAPAPIAAATDGSASADAGASAIDAGAIADVTVPVSAPVDAGGELEASESATGDATEGGLDAQPEAAGQGPAMIEIVAPDAGIGGVVTGLAQENGILYGSSNNTSPGTGPVWRATTSGADFRFIAPYDANANGRVAGFAVSDPNAFFAVNLGPETGVRYTALDGGVTDKVVGFYQGVVLGADPPAGARVYISDGRTPGFDVEPKTGNPNPEAPPTIKCNRYPEAYPAPLQIMVDASLRVYWLYNGKTRYPPPGQPAPLVQSIRAATSDQVTAWGNTGCKAGQWTELVSGVDVTGIGIDGSYVYYADASEGIWRVPAQGGAPLKLTASVTMPGHVEGPGALYVDDARVYWAPGTGNIWAIAKDGSSSGPLVSLVPPGTSRSAITALALDESFIYFADSGDGSVWKLKK